MVKFKLPEVFHDGLQLLELLALLQHHGIPTRLLDTTENALVALYFACCADEDKDGEVFAFKNNELDVTNYPVTNAIADSYRFCRSTFCTLDLFYGAVISQPYFLEQKQLHEICNDKPQSGGRWIAECCKSHFLFMRQRKICVKKCNPDVTFFFQIELHLTEKVLTRVVLRALLIQYQRITTIFVGKLLFQKK